MPPTLPKPWTTQRCSASFQPSRSQARAIDHHDAGAGRLVPEDRAADRDRLAGHDLRHRVAALHRVRVHHPGHRLLVRRHVRRGDVLLRPDERQQLRREPPRQPLELAAATARAGCSGRRPSRRRRAAAAARTSTSSTPRAPRTRRARPPGRSGCRPSSGRARSSAARGSRGRRRACRRRGLTGHATMIDALRVAQPLGDAGVDVRVRHGLVELRDRGAVERRVPLEVGERRDVLGARHRAVSVTGRRLAPGAGRTGRRPDVRMCRGWESNPACPEGQPVLSRPRLTSSATPAGCESDVSCGREAACPAGSAPGPGTGTRRRTPRTRSRRTVVHFARYAVPFAGSEALFVDPGAERDLVAERRVAARGPCRGSAPGRSSAAAHVGRGTSVAVVDRRSPPCSRLCTSCAC